MWYTLPSADTGERLSKYSVFYVSGERGGRERGKKKGNKIANTARSAHGYRRNIGLIGCDKSSLEVARSGRIARVYTRVSTKFIYPRTYSQITARGQTVNGRKWKLRSKTWPDCETAELCSLEILIFD